MSDSVLSASLLSSFIPRTSDHDNAPLRAHCLFVSRSSVMREQAPERAGTMASDRHGAFPLVLTFDRPFRLGSQITVDCWIDGASVERNKFAVSLARRAAASRATWGTGDQALPCISKCLGQDTASCMPNAAVPMPGDPTGAAPKGASAKKVLVKMVLVTTPTVFQPGEQLLLTITLAGARGCEIIRQGSLFFGGDTPSACTLEELELPDQVADGAP